MLSVLTDGLTAYGDEAKHRRHHPRGGCEGYINQAARSRRGAKAIKEEQNSNSGRGTHCLPKWKASLPYPGSHIP